MVEAYLLTGLDSKTLHAVEQSRTELSCWSLLRLVVQACAPHLCLSCFFLSDLSGTCAAAASVTAAGAVAAAIIVKMIINTRSNMS